MVDLVKIRKKAKKEREDAAPPPPETAAPAPEAAAGPVTAPQAAVVREGGQTGRRSGGTKGKPSTPEKRTDTAGTPAETAPASTASEEPPDIPAGPASSKLERFKELAGRRRDGGGQAGAVAAEESQQERLEMLTFLIGAEQYAVDIERIVEIVTPRPITRIPNSDPAVVGIISLRGTIVTLVDVRRKLRHGPAGEDDAETRVVVMDYGAETVGFTVDRVLRVVKVTPGEIEPHPVVHAAELDEAIRGVFRVGDALTILLDLDKLLGTAQGR